MTKNTDIAFDILMSAMNEINARELLTDHEYGQLRKQVQEFLEWDVEERNATKEERSEHERKVQKFEWVEDFPNGGGGGEVAIKYSKIDLRKSDVKAEGHQYNPNCGHCQNPGASAAGQGSCTSCGGVHPKYMCPNNSCN